MTTSLFDLATIAPITPPRQAAEQLSACFYSLPGVGKTRLAGSISEVAEASPVLLMDFEGGSSVLAHSYPNVDVVQVNEWATGKALVEALVNEDHKYKTVILDTVGEAQEQIKSWSVQQFGESNPYKKYEDIADQMTRSIRFLHKSGMNVIVIAHVERDKDEIRRSLTYRPYTLGKKSSVELPKTFDVIGYLTMEEDEDSGEPYRALQLHPSPGIEAKDRTGLLPARIVEPTFEKIYSYFTKSEK